MPNLPHTSTAIESDGSAIKSRFTAAGSAPFSAATPHFTSAPALSSGEVGAGSAEIIDLGGTWGVEATFPVTSAPDAEFTISYAANMVQFQDLDTLENWTTSAAANVPVEWEPPAQPAPPFTRRGRSRNDWAGAALAS